MPTSRKNLIEKYSTSSLTHILTYSAGFLFILIYLSGCEDFIDVDLTKSRITSDIVYSDNNTATAAVTGIYHNMLESAITQGNRSSFSRLSGLSADELQDIREIDGVYDFEINELTSDNSNVASLWSSFYSIVYQTNAVLEGLQNSKEITNDVEDQLTGEVLFIRALCHFYLVNIFGDIPLVLSTDYNDNSLIERAQSLEVYAQIIQDLLTAKDLLNTDYVTNERVRPNKSTALSLLARVYLYNDNMSEAIANASEVINNNAYSLEENLNNTFLKNSSEAIWQLMPVDPNYNTNDAQYYVITGNPTYLTLRDNIIDDFDINDLRLSNWVGSVTNSEGTFYYPFKYKVYERGAPLTEYLMVFRLAELHLIRAEAKARTGDIDGAIEDIDMIRSRAGLSLIQDVNPNISQSELILEIEQQRRLELFTEWGHRWLDLKRTNRASTVLGTLKSTFTATDKLYPIPLEELERNPSLGGNQNPGY